MALIILNPSKSLNKAYRKQKPHRTEFDNFKLHLHTLLESINEKESEEYNKNLVRDFLLNTFYTDFNVNTKGNTDLAVYLKKTNKVGIIVETKSPSNNSEMVRKDDINKKAMHEAMLYYLRERIEEKNDEIKNIIITNNYQWFIFDAQVFEKLFYKNNGLKTNYESWNTNQKVSSNTAHFYNEIAKPFLINLQDDIPFSYFDLNEYRTQLDNDKKLIPLFKVFSRAHLLKESFANDSNSLDKQFYNELLHIIGLEETKEGSKKVITRKAESKRESGSLLENTINILKTEDSLSYISNRESFGEAPEEQIYNLALELNITWVNRILFLKLLEGQLLTYHKGNKDYKFLDDTKLTEYDDLYELFHKVLALSIDERDKEIKTKYQFVPYLNSSLFEISKLERDSIRISQLQDHAGLSILSQTKLRDNLNKKRSGTLPTLTYLLQFLDAYDFATESTGNKIQEEGKTLISASVLGLIFEKINGYKEGSFFTPGFITMYMARETIRRAVVQKFNATLNANYKDFEELKTEIDTTKDGREKANSIINSLKICDPAVGSGHFLVSALNEIIVVKSELGVLIYNDGRHVQDYSVDIENDELIITDVETEDIFEYHLNDKNNIIAPLQNLQETLFHEKQTIIENSLFGVDINPNSVNICRLRLWIELLKNAYYNDANGYKELQTLPNIDINIKQGNSLVSRFDVSDTKFTKGDKRTLEEYKLNVAAYKNVNNRIARKELKDSIDRIKTKFIGLASDPLRKEKDKLTKLASDLHNLNSELFGADNEKSKVKQLKLEKDIEKLSKTIEQK
jgi:adenine-specific DNA-methyltransferase